MVSLFSFWFKSRRRIFTLGVLAVIGLSAFMAILTSGSKAVLLVPQPVRPNLNVARKEVDFDNELNQFLHHGKKGADTVAEESEKPKPELSVKMASTENDKFDSERVLALFTSCRGENSVLSLDCYVDAYEELCKLFNLFGTVFGFVSSDVIEKIGILRDYRKSSEAEHYATIQDMLTYEVKQGTTANKKKASGSRTLLRLHRALEFISALLVKIKETDNTVKFSTVATKAYDDTLAKHHPWLVKKAVHVAMYIIPTRQDMLKKMNVKDNEEGMKSLSNLIKELNAIYGVTQELYAKDNLLDLP